MDGATLCNCALEELRLVFGPLGDQLHAQLRDLNGFRDCKKGDPKHGKRKRGRPRKLSKEYWDCLEGKKSKHAPRGTHLWEFIRDILIHPELNEGLMKWENRHEGVFKFLRSEAVAQLWGQKKKNSNMTYEKLSRAMRYYYKREILERVDGRRLVYKFGKNSSGWKEEEVLQSRN
uniref:E74-like ETS transcription factor 3 isoform 18 n=1 Tax=Homo sapiens TaxID=9606 RepID=A0A8E8V181_HUMAN|nr:E74-like ETS transcription factor 3 isoform 18 [Homo sapiens]